MTPDHDSTDQHGPDVSRPQYHRWRKPRIDGWKDGLSQIASSRRPAKEALHLSLNSSCRLSLTLLLFTAALAACGGSTALSPSPVASTPSVTALPVPTTTAAPSSCPSAAAVGSTLGITVPKPVGVPYRGGTPLPAGAAGEACDYHAQSFNVLIEVLTNISPSYITQFSSRFPVPYKSVSGVGDQARSFTVSLGGGKDNEGVVATKGSTLVSVVATGTPASLTQIETLVNQLL